MKQRRTFDASFKASVAMNILTGKCKLSEAAKQYDIAEEVIIRWKNQMVADSYKAFERSSSAKLQQRYDRLQRKHDKAIHLNNFAINCFKRLKNDINFIPFIDSLNSKLSVRQQCEILGVDRNKIYHQYKSPKAKFSREIKNIGALYFATEHHTTDDISIFLRGIGMSINTDSIRDIMETMEMLPAEEYNLGVPYSDCFTNLSECEKELIVVDVIPTLYNDEMRHILLIAQLGGEVLYLNEDELIRGEDYHSQLLFELQVFTTKIRRCDYILFRRKSLYKSEIINSYLSKVKVRAKYIPRGSDMDHYVRMKIFDAVLSNSQKYELHKQK